MSAQEPKQELKSCPFCGGIAQVQKNEIDEGRYNHHEFWLECGTCLIRTSGEHGPRFVDEPTEKILKILYETWNRRYPDQGGR